MNINTPNALLKVQTTLHAVRVRLEEFVTNRGAQQMSIQVCVCCCCCEDDHPILFLPEQNAGICHLRRRYLRRHIRLRIPGWDGRGQRCIGGLNPIAAAADGILNPDS